MSKIVSGTYISSDIAVGVECGFVPDKVRLTTAIGGTELIFDWLKAMGDTSALTGQYGIKDDAGAKTHATTAATGIIALDSSETGVLIESPADSGKKVFASVSDWVATTNYSTGERTVTTIGTIVRPPDHIGKVFELTTDTSTGDSEPTGGWNVQPGDTVTDGGGNIWTCREENITNRGLKGFTVGVDICTNGEIHAFTAEKHDRAEDMGDADVENPVRFAN